MKQIRRSVFETNSSSTHSVTILHNGLEPNYMSHSEDGFIHTQIGEYGWEIEDYDDQQDRLSYLITMLAEKNGLARWWRSEETLEEHVENLMKTEDFKRVSDEIGEYAGCLGVIIDPSDGYIDHQSQEDYRTFQDFLNEYSTNVVEFVYGRGNIIHTDNDNH